MDVYVHPEKLVAYLPITKNASTTFTHLFSNAGWQRQQLDQLNSKVQVFGHFRDPIERHFKGTAEFLVQNNLVHMLANPDWQKIYMSAVLDIHSYPITWSLGTNLNRVKWIPIDRKISTNYLTNQFLLSYGIDYNILSIVWRHESDIERQRVYYELRKLHEQQEQNLLSYFYDSDILLWNRLFPYIDEDNIEHRIN